MRVDGCEQEKVEKEKKNEKSTYYASMQDAARGGERIVLSFSYKP